MNLTIVRTLAAGRSEFQGSLLAPVAGLLGGGVVLVLTLLLGTILMRHEDGRIRPSSSLGVSALATAVTTGYVYVVFGKELPETILVGSALSLSFALGVTIARGNSNWSIGIATAILADFVLISMLFSNSYRGMVLVSLIGGTVPFGLGYLSTED